jgi:hypothetical protein
LYSISDTSTTIDRSWLQPSKSTISKNSLVNKQQLETIYEGTNESLSGVVDETPGSTGLDSSKESNSLSQTISTAIESVLKSELPISETTQVNSTIVPVSDAESTYGSDTDNDSQLESVDTMDLGNIIATSVESALKSSISSSSKASSDSRHESIQNKSVSEGDISAKIDLGNAIPVPSALNSQESAGPPGQPLSVQGSVQGSSLPQLSGLLELPGSAPSASVPSPVPPPVPPEFTSGFLLVCPSSMKVVSIFNHNTNTNTNGFAYDNNMSNSKLPSFTEGTIDIFIQQIEKLINTPNICKESTIDIKTDTLATLFANGFIRALQSVV